MQNESTSGKMEITLPNEQIPQQIGAVKPMSQILNLPARKVFIKDLVDCCRISSVTGADSNTGHPHGKKVKEWLVSCSGRKFKVTVAWIQGLVEEVNDTDGYLMINDGTGKAKIIGHKKIPFICTKLHQGQYVMAVGKLTSAGQCPNLLAMKIQNLFDQENAEKSWPLEVMDQILHVP